MAYKVGAKLANMEFLYYDYVTLRAGGGIVGCKPYDKLGKLVNRNGDIIINNEEESVMRCFLMQKEMIEGRSPLYWDLRELPQEVLKMYDREMSHEYPITKQWFKERGIDIRKNLVPNKLDPCCIVGGPLVDETYQTSVPGLFAAGATNAFVRAIGGCSVSGHIAGERAARYASTIKLPELSTEYFNNIEKSILKPINRKYGIDPKELELTVRILLSNYVGLFRNEDIMNYALERLLDLKGHYENELAARNPHELMRCCEVKSIMDFAEMHIRAALYRKETRFRKLANFVHFRVDYPKTDPDWGKWVVIQKDEDNNMALNTLEVPELKEA
jgi:succinate dehydrogenase/fumarate reductase flavoprotein subunit